MSYQIATTYLAEAGRGILGAVVVVALLVAAAPAYAETRSPPEATAHALDELANVCAQHRPECPATVTLTTWTPSPTSTSTPLPTDTPTPTPMASPTPTPEPCWLTDEDLGDPDNGYIVFDGDGAPVPCPPDQPLPTEEPTPTAEPRAVSTETPVPVRPAPAAAIVASQSVAAAAPQLQVVVQTVVVVVTAVPIDTPVPTSTPRPTSTPLPTRTAAATGTATTTPTPAPAALGSASPVPSPVARDAQGVPTATQGRWDWGVFARDAAIVVALLSLAIWLLTRRRVVVWSGRPKKPTGDAHA